MKKAIFASILMLATLTACQSEMQNDLNPSPGKSVKTESINKNTAREGGSEAPRWDKPSNDPYALDGYVHVLRDKVVFMGEERSYLDSKSQVCHDIYAYLNGTQDTTTSRAVTRSLCSSTLSDGSVLTLVDVCNSGVCNSYFDLYFPGSGNHHTWSNDGWLNNYAITCMTIYWMGTDWGW